MQIHCNESTGIQHPLLRVHGNKGKLGSQYIPYSHLGSTRKSNSVCKWPGVPEELQTTATWVASAGNPASREASALTHQGSKALTELDIKLLQNSPKACK